MLYRFSIQFYIQCIQTYGYINGSCNDDKTYSPELIFKSLQKITGEKIIHSENGWTYNEIPLHIGENLYENDPVNNVFIEDIYGSKVNNDDVRISEFKTFNEMHSSKSNDKCILIIYKQGFEKNMTTQYLRMWPNHTYTIQSMLNEKINVELKCDNYENFIYNYNNELKMAYEHPNLYDYSYYEALFDSYVHLESYTRKNGELHLTGIDMCSYLHKRASFGNFMCVLDMWKRDLNNHTNVFYAMISPEVWDILHNYDGGQNVSNLFMC
jgi:hypothetical protein